MQLETNKTISGQEIIHQSSKYIAGGVVSLNRKVSRLSVAYIIFQLLVNKVP